MQITETYHAWWRDVGQFLPPASETQSPDVRELLKRFGASVFDQIQNGNKITELETKVDELEEQLKDANESLSDAEQDVETLKEIKRLIQ